MACNHCYGAQKDIILIGNPVEAQCEYCGEKFIIGKPNQCLSCIYYSPHKTDEGYRYRCDNDDADGNENCSGYEKE